MEYELLITTFGLGACLIYLAVLIIKRKRFSMVQLKNTKRSTIAKNDTQDTEHFKHLTATKPHDPNPWLLWGNTLVHNANQISKINLKLHKLNEACSCYNHAIEINPQFIPGWLAWGKTLYAISRLNKCSDIFTIEGGHTKFHNAVNLAPLNPAIWADWGNELTQLAAAAPLEQQRHLLEQAKEYLAKAQELGIQPESTAEEKQHDGDSTQGIDENPLLANQPTETSSENDLPTIQSAKTTDYDTAQKATQPTTSLFSETD